MGFIISSCEKETGVDIPEPKLKVTEADVIFETQGGDGFIKVVAPGAITAESSGDWCTVSVSGTTVNLTASENIGLGGRTAVITIKSGEEKIDVTAVQTSSIMWFKEFIDSSLGYTADGGVLKSAVITSYPITVKSKPDWLNYKFENDSIYLTVPASSKPRKGTITFTSEGRDITYDILQLSYGSLLGDWTFEYSTSEGGSRLKFDLKMEQNVKDNSYKLGLFSIATGLSNSIELRFDQSIPGVILTNRQYMGAIPGDAFPHVYACMARSATSLSTSTTVQMVGIIDITDDGTVTCTLKDNGTWSGSTAIGFGFFNWANQELTGSIYRQKIYINIVMTKK